jgi:hypothetical protein
MKDQKTPFSAGPVPSLLAGETGELLRTMDRAKIPVIESSVSDGGPRRLPARASTATGSSSKRAFGARGFRDS